MCVMITNLLSLEGSHSVSSMAAPMWLLTDSRHMWVRPFGGLFLWVHWIWHLDSAEFPHEMVFKNPLTFRRRYWWAYLSRMKTAHFKTCDFWLTLMLISILWTILCKKKTQKKLVEIRCKWQQKKKLYLTSIVFTAQWLLFFQKASFFSSYSLFSMKSMTLVFCNHPLQR